MGIGTLKNNGVSAEQKAEMLNNQFTSVFTTENTGNIPSKGNSPFIPMKDITIGEKALNRLNPGKATCPDKIPLQYYGIGGTTRTWTDTFFSNRIQKVVVDGESSRCSFVTSGVPQGTVLGPTLFLNDIADNLRSTARLIEDDCVIYRPIHTENDHQLLQEDFDTQ
ncbi:unnamed protein product [Mytilus coruscus]|uniref:Uncharacterized protein n=1 Tax=Mytilus coruscus TaxID=42192 RepID=A0A6J8E5D0_MYTCO|nr:unnamed protein product [Mytilus coruscus]